MKHLFVMILMFSAVAQAKDINIHCTNKTDKTFSIKIETKNDYLSGFPLNPFNWGWEYMHINTKHVTYEINGNQPALDKIRIDVKKNRSAFIIIFKPTTGFSKTSYLLKRLRKTKTYVDKKRRIWCRAAL